MRLGGFLRRSRRRVSISLAVATFGGLLPVAPVAVEASDGTVKRAVYPPANGTQPVTPVSALDLSKAPVVSRTETSTVYERPDGWHEAVISSSPVNWHDPETGRWLPIDTDLVAGANSRYHNASGPFSVSFTAETGGGPLVTVARDGWNMAFAVDGAAPGRTAVVDGPLIRYPEVFPGVDLEYVVGPDSVREIFVVKRPVPPEISARFRFNVETSGGRIDVAEDGVVVLDDQGRKIATLPQGTMTDAAGRAGSVAVQARRAARTTTVDVVPDPAYREKPISYPWRIDPDIEFLGAQGSFDAYASSAYPSSNYDGAAEFSGGLYLDKAGYEVCQGCEEFYSFQYFDLSPIANREILTATWEGFAWATRGTGNFKLWAVAEEWTAASIRWDARPDHRTDAAGFRDGTALGGSTVNVDVTAWVRKWLDPQGWPNHGIAINTAGTNSYVAFGAMEDPANRPQIRVSYNPGPAVSYSQLFGGSETITTTTPTLTGSDVAGMQYAFRIGTSADVDSAPVVTSILQPTRTWTVPAGVLRDGGVYYRKVYTYNGTAWASSPPRRFQVNRRLGEQAVSPTDAAGPVSVNLATGNVFYRHSSPVFQTTGGPIGASFAYNSQAPSSYGLTGAYTANCDGTQPWADSRPTARRHDTGNVNGTTWNMSFPGAPITGSVDTDSFCVRWSGYLTVPYAATGSSYYSFGLVHSDGAAIYLDNNFATPYLSAGGSGGPHYGGLMQFSSSQTVPITIDLVDPAGSANVELHVSGAENGQVPIHWLSLTPPVLPTGWSTSLDATGTVAYTAAVIEDEGATITLLGPGGEPSLFAADDSGQAWEPISGDPSTISKTPAGDFVVRGADGMTYVFDSRGKLESASAGTDRTNYAAPTYEFDASGRLKRVREPLSNLARYMELVYYTGPGTCPTKTGFDSVPPAGHLCQINYTWDSTPFVVDDTSTKLYYQSERLVLIEDPGDPTAGASDGREETRFGYHVGGKLRSIRSVLGSDYANRGLRTDNDLLRTVIEYTGDKALSVTLPEPAPGQARPAHSYRYISAGETQMDVAGLTQPQGFFRKTVFNVAGQATAETDATGLVTAHVWDWNPTDQRLWTIAPNGLKTGFVHDAGRLVATHGPAPESCFYDEFNEIGSWCTATAPVSTTWYDDFDGLGAAFWDGAAEFSGDDGRPDGEELAFKAPSTTVTRTWTATDRPPGVGNGPWSGQFTGRIGVNGPDTVTFRLDRAAGDKARLFVNDTLVVDRWNDTNPDQGDISLGQGYHRVRVDYVNPGGTADGSMTLNWFNVDDPSVPDGGPVPNSYVQPSYGLVSRNYDPDGHLVISEYAKPENGLLTASVVFLNPGELRTEYGYENFTNKQISRRLPRQTATSGPAVTYDSYGDNDSPPSNECAETAVQAGFTKQTTETSGIVRLHLYDERGRTVGSKVQTDSRWSCAIFDDRGRPASTVNRAGQTTTFSYPYSEPGRADVAFNDSAGTARTTEEVTDLLGRTTRYKDEWGTQTYYSYDQAGRLTETSRALPGMVTRTVTTHSYDAAGRLTTLTDWSSGVGRVTAYGYDDGRLASVTRPNGTTTTYTFEDTVRGELKNIDHKRGATVLSPWTYTRNRSGTIASEATTGRTRTFTYDNAGRLTRTVEGATTRNYAYDQNSNRCANAISCTGAYTYDNADRLTASSDPRYANLQYDKDSAGVPLSSPQGNLTRMGNTYLTYDANDHVTVIDDGTTRVVETLDPSGRVLERKVTSPPGGTVTEWVVYGYGGSSDSPAYEQTHTGGTPNWTSPLLTAEDWTGSWATRWTTSTSGTATVDVSSGRGRLYVSGASDARAMVNAAPTANSETALTFEFSDLANRSGFRVGLRGCNAVPACNAMPMNSGYRVDVVSDQSTVSIRRIVGGSHTTMGSFSYTKAAATKYRIRVRLVDYTVSVKLWKATDPEPAAWSSVVTDTDMVNRVGGTGRLHLHHNGTAGARNVYVDDLIFTDLSKTRKTNIGGPDGLHVTDTNGEPTYPHPNAHGDLAGATDITGGYTGITMSDEYGKGAPPASRLGWLGSQQRPTTHGASGLIRMGVRLYDPSMGRFLSVDPIEGGCANDYNYVTDPINHFDLSGEICGYAADKSLRKSVTSVVNLAEKVQQEIGSEGFKSLLKLGGKRWTWMTRAASAAARYSKFANLRDLAMTAVDAFCRAETGGEVNRQYIESSKNGDTIHMGAEGGLLYPPIGSRKK